MLQTYKYKINSVAREHAAGSGPSTFYFSLSGGKRPLLVTPEGKLLEAPVKLREEFNSDKEAPLSNDSARAIAKSIGGIAFTDKEIKYDDFVNAFKFLSIPENFEEGGNNLQQLVKEGTAFEYLDRGRGYIEDVTLSDGKLSSKLRREPNGRGIDLTMNLSEGFAREDFKIESIRLEKMLHVYGIGDEEEQDSFIRELNGHFIERRAMELQYNEIGEGLNSKVDKHTLVLSYHTPSLSSENNPLYASTVSQASDWLSEGDGWKIVHSLAPLKRMIHNFESARKKAKDILDERRSYVSERKRQEKKAMEEEAKVFIKRHNCFS